MLDYLRLMLLELAPTEDEGGEGAAAEGEGIEENADDGIDESGTSTEEGDEEGESVFEVDGEQFTAEQIRELKKGNLRQSDYTKKTQQAARERQEAKEALELYNFIKSNPELAQTLNEKAGAMDKNVPKIVDPNIENLQIEFYGMKLDTQMNAIKAKDPDANEVEILTICAEEGCDADKAYNIWRGQNFDKILEKKLNQKSSEITQNIKKNGIVTKTIINGKPIKNDSSHGLSQAELRMAEKLDMTPEDYAKWK